MPSCSVAVPTSRASAASATAAIDERSTSPSPAKWHDRGDCDEHERDDQLDRGRDGSQRGNANTA